MGIGMAGEKAKFDFEVLQTFGKSKDECDAEVRLEMQRWRASGGTGVSLARQFCSLYRQSAYQFFAKFGAHNSAPVVLAIEDYRACGFPALLPLVRDRHEDLVAELIRRGADLEWGDDDGTPLVWAALQAHLVFSRAYTGKFEPEDLPVLTRIAAMLIDAGANPNAYNYRGCTPLIHAAAGGVDEMVAKLLAAGADVHRYYGDLGRTALHEAVVSEASKLLGETAGSSSVLRTVRLLLDAGANPNGRNFRGNTPLHELAMAAERFTPDVLQATLTVLVEAGGNLELRNAEGMTPLLLAAQNNKGAALALPVFIEAGANTQVKTPYGVGVAQMGNPETKRLYKATLLAQRMRDAMGDGAQQEIATRDTSGVL